MKRFSKTVRVEVRNISVSKEGWYSFDFWYRVNGKLKEYGNLDGSYSGRTSEAFREVLQRGWAIQLVLQKYA